MKDFIYCIIWLAWYMMAGIVAFFDKRRLDDNHWTWAVRPTSATDRIVKKYGCLMNAFKKYHLVWAYDLIR